MLKRVFKPVCKNIADALPISNADKENIQEGCHVVGSAAVTVGGGVARVAGGITLGVLGGARPLGSEDSGRDPFQQIDESNYKAEQISNYSHSC